MPDWNDQLLAVVDDHYDRDNASDGTSRYGAYLRQNASLFRDVWSDEPGPVQDPAEFAVHAWTVATAPIMVPGYVRIRPDLSRITLHRDEDDHGLYADIHLPLHHAHIGGNTRRFPYAWQDWTQEVDYSGTKYLALSEPRSTKKPAVLASATVRVPGTGWRLVTPTAYEGRTLVDEAREAVTVLAQLINEDAGPIVARLLSA